MTFLYGAVLAIMLTLGGFGYWQYHENIVMHVAVRSAEMREQQKDVAVKQLTEDLSATVKRIEFVETQNILIQSNIHSSMKVLEKHDAKDLNELALKKTSLIEHKVNVATQAAFTKLENLTDPNWRP